MWASPRVWTNSPGFKLQTCATICSNNEYEAILKGTPKNISHDLWYICRLNLPSATKNWKNAWHGGRAILSSSPGFHAFTIILLEEGLFFIKSMAFFNWSVSLPSGFFHFLH